MNCYVYHTVFDMTRAYDLTFTFSKQVFNGSLDFSNRPKPIKRNLANSIRLEH